MQSLEVQAGYSVKLSVVITAFPAPQVALSLDDEVRWITNLLLHTYAALANGIPVYYNIVYFHYRKSRKGRSLQLITMSQRTDIPYSLLR